MTKTPLLLVVGSINRDVILHIPRWPAVGENVLASDSARLAGGKGANQAVAAARLGAKVAFVGSVGDDADGTALRDSLVAAEVPTRFVRIDRTRNTGIAVVMVGADGNNRIIVDPGANLAVTADDVRSACDALSPDGVLIQFELAPATIIATCAYARKLGIPAFIDAGPAQLFPLEELGAIAVLSPNESEAHMLTGIVCDNEPAIERACAALARRSQAAAIVLKLGSRGAALWHKGHYQRLAAHAVTAIDATAAGDAFTAALAIRRLSGDDLASAVAYANFAGALATTVRGAQPSLPTASAIAAFRRTHAEQLQQARNQPCRSRQLRGDSP